MKKKYAIALYAALAANVALAGCGKNTVPETSSSQEASKETTTETTTEGAQKGETSDYLYGYTEMTFADFWYGELENTEDIDGFDLKDPDLTAQSETYLHYSYSSPDDADIYAGVQKNTWDNDSGMYDAVSRATVGYGLYRSSFANVVEVKLDDGSKQIYSSEITPDDSPTGYSVDLNTNQVPGIVYSKNTRLDTEASTGYTPDTDTVYEKSAGGYRIVALKKVPVKVKKSTVEAAQKLTDAGETNGQLEAFNAQLEKITFVDDMTSYACKELYANGIYGAREKNEDAQVLDAGHAYIGNGENKTKAIAHGDGFADLTMYVYLDAYDGYTTGSILDLKEETLDTLYADSATPTYAENKEGADKLAGFMDYALNFQGAKLQWAGEDGTFDTDDDVFVGNMLHKDSYFSFNHGNYIEVSITNGFERFKESGNGDYRITLISEGYADATAEADNLVLDYKTPMMLTDDVPALGADETTISVQLDASQVKVSLDDDVNKTYLAELEGADLYQLCYEDASGRSKEQVVVCESAASVEKNGEIYTVTFDVSGKELPEDIHYEVVLSTTSADAATLEFHYALVD